MPEGLSHEQNKNEGAEMPPSVDIAKLNPEKLEEKLAETAATAVERFVAADAQIFGASEAFDDENNMDEVIRISRGLANLNKAALREASSLIPGEVEMQKEIRIGAFEYAAVIAEQNKIPKSILTQEFSNLICDIPTLSSDNFSTLTTGLQQLKISPNELSAEAQFKIRQWVEDSQESDMIFSYEILKTFGLNQEKILKDPKFHEQIKDKITTEIVSNYFGTLLATFKTLDVEVSYQDLESNYLLPWSVSSRLIKTVQANNKNEFNEAVNEINHKRTIAWKNIVTQLESKVGTSGAFKQIEHLIQDIDNQAIQRYENLFIAKNIESPETPPQIKELELNFVSKYGAKGKTMISLGIMAYGTQNPDTIVEKMTKYEKILDRYDAAKIPEGAHVSMGFEKEITNSIVNQFDKEHQFLPGYVVNAATTSEIAGVGRGLDAEYEFASRPSYNPYAAMVESLILQDMGFFDFNFKYYKTASRGFHMSLVGDTGLIVGQDMLFANNILFMSQTQGVVAGGNIGTEGVRSNNFDVFDKHQQGGVRIEFRDVGGDSIEQFEKSTLFLHRAGVCSQVFNKYINTESKAILTSQIKNLGNTPEEFETQLTSAGMLIKPFESSQERAIAFAWAKLRFDTEKAVISHNNNYIASEWEGGFLDENEEWIDTSDHIDKSRISNLLNVKDLKTGPNGEPPVLSTKTNIPTSFLYQPIGNELIRPLTLVNNITLKYDEKSQGVVNASSVIDVKKTKGYKLIDNSSPYESITTTGGNLHEGYYVIQGASEEMISQKSQLILNEFLERMENLLEGNKK